MSYSVSVGSEHTSHPRQLSLIFPWTKTIAKHGPQLEHLGCWVLWEYWVEAGWLKPSLVLIFLQEPSGLSLPPSVSQQGRVQLLYCPPLLLQKIQILSNVLDTLQHAITLPPCAYAKLNDRLGS